MIHQQTQQCRKTIMGMLPQSQVFYSPPDTFVPPMPELCCKEFRTRVLAHIHCHSLHFHQFSYFSTMLFLITQTKIIFKWQIFSFWKIQTSLNTQIQSTWPQGSLQSKRKLEIRTSGFQTNETSIWWGRGIM